MELHVEIDALVSRIADALRRHEERLLSELMARISKQLGAPSGSTAVTGQSEDIVIKGIQLHALYSVSFVADRWDVSDDNVRKKSDEELPRSDWKGGEIRYRGIDILRYEGVDVEEHLDNSSPELEEEAQSPELRQLEDHPRREGDGNGNGRPYSSDLPALSDDSAPTD